MEEIYNNPKHPYTWGLLESQITSDQDTDEPLPSIPGSPPDLSYEVKGCPFVDRCPYAQDICREKPPELIETDSDHLVACHFQTKDKTLERRRGYADGNAARS